MVLEEINYHLIRVISSLPQKKSTGRNDTIIWFQYTMIYMRYSLEIKNKYIHIFTNTSTRNTFKRSREGPTLSALVAGVQGRATRDTATGTPALAATGHVRRKLMRRSVLRHCQSMYSAHRTL